MWWEFFHWEGEALLPSPSSVTWLHLGASAAPFAGGHPALRGKAREEFPISVVSVLFLSLKIIKKPQTNTSKKSFSTTPSCFFLLSVTFARRHRDAHPSPGAGHMGCPDLGIGVNPPTLPREVMSLVEEATLILPLGFSCHRGVKG